MRDSQARLATAPPRSPGAARARAGPHRHSGARNVDELLEELGVELGALLDGLCEADQRPPVGRWLGDDLVAAAMSATDGVIRQAAVLVGLPESTFRRRLDKIRNGVDRSRSRDWEPIQHLLERLVEANRERRLALLKATEKRLLEQLVGKLPGQVKCGSALLGVSAPTYRSRVAALGQ